MVRPSETPLISVIIPVFNAEKYVAQAIESVVAQGYANLEILIVDDGSVDNSRSIVESIDAPIEYFYQENSGPSAARNRGLFNAKGDFIAFLDADDLYPDNKFNTQLSTFEENPGLEIVTGRIQYVYLEGAEKKIIDFERDDNTLVHVHLGSMLSRRSAFDKIGPFDEGLRFSEDIEWWLRVRELKIPYKVLDEITLQYRLHESNMTRGRSGIDRPFFQALKKSLDRRRTKGDMYIKKMTDFEE